MKLELNGKVLYENPYTEEQLKAAFEKVQDKDHWKNPIRAIIPVTEDINVIAEAIKFYTATIPSFNQVSPTEWLVSADGYYAGPAGDH